LRWTECSNTQYLFRCMNQELLGKWNLIRRWNNISTQHMHYNFFKIFKHGVMVIQSVWIKKFSGSMSCSWIYSYFLLSSVRRLPVTSLLTGLWRHQERSIGKAKQLFSPKHAHQFWGPTNFLLNKRRGFFPRVKRPRREVNTSVQCQGWDLVQRSLPTWRGDDLRAMTSPLL